MRALKLKLSRIAEDSLVNVMAVIAIVLIGSLLLVAVAILIPFLVIALIVLHIIVLWEEYGIRIHSSNSNK